MQEVTRINLDITINSGQVFLWDKIDGIWYGVNGTEILRVKQDPFEITSSQKKPSDFFRQDDNMEKILNKISRDNLVRSAVKSLVRKWILMIMNFLLFLLLRSLQKPT